MDNSIPGLERGIWVLQHLSRHPDGLAAADLIQASGVPRATLYRIVRTLRAHGFLAPSPRNEARLVLGPALAGLAKQATQSADMRQRIQPFMDALSREIGETVKLVARDGTEAVTMAATPSPNDSRIAARVGTRLPLYVGASQRLLLAFAPQQVQDRVLNSTLRAVASRTVTSADQLRLDLARLRSRAYASGHSEGVEGVGAFAAAVRDPLGEVNHAIAAVYIHGGKSAEERRRIAQATLAAAQHASEAP